jgi:hypothetical protein
MSEILVGSVCNLYPQPGIAAPRSTIPKVAMDFHHSVAFSNVPDTPSLTPPGEVA